MLVADFESNPEMETNLGVAQAKNTIILKEQTNKSYTDFNDGKGFVIWMLSSINRF